MVRNQTGSGYMHMLVRRMREQSDPACSAATRLAACYGGCAGKLVSKSVSWSSLKSTCLVKCAHLVELVEAAEGPEVSD